MPKTSPAIAAASARRPLVAFHQHEHGRTLVLALFDRGYDTGPPFTLADEHGELTLTASQLEQLVTDSGPAALRRYHERERALLDGALEDEPTTDARQLHVFASHSGVPRKAIA